MPHFACSFAWLCVLIDSWYTMMLGLCACLCFVVGSTCMCRFTNVVSRSCQQFEEQATLSCWLLAGCSNALLAAPHGVQQPSSMRLDVWFYVICQTVRDASFLL
jgi:hypothetical protein